jgi:hypothetical protein
MLRSALTCLAALLLSGSAFGLDCPSPEKKGQTPGGYTICKPSATGQCGPGRKYTKHARELVPMCEEGGPARAQPKPAAPVAGKCPAGEEAAKWRTYDICKPIGGACGKGRRNVPHHRDASLIVCENDPNGAQHVPEITCKEHERPHMPRNKTIKPFCEPVGGRCGSLRVAVASDVPGKQMCIDK